MDQKDSRFFRPQRLFIPFTGFIILVIGLIVIAGLMLSMPYLVFMLLAVAIALFAHKSAYFKMSIEKSLYLEIAVAAFLVIMVTLHFYKQMNFQNEVQNEVENSLETQHGLNELMSKTLDVQTAVRGYLLSRDDKFLLPAYSAKEQIPVILHSLDSLLSLTISDASDFTRLRTYVNERVSFADKMIETEKSEGIDSALRLFDTGYGKMLTDSIRNIIKRLDSNQHNVIEEKRINEKKMEAESVWLILINFVIMIMLLGVVLRVALGGIKSRNKSLAEFRKLNCELEDKVLKRTSELTESEMKYRKFFENNPLPMFFYDVETSKFIEVNNTALITYGYTETEFLNMSIFEIRPPEDRDKLKTLLSETNGVYSKIQGLRHIKKNGKVIYVEVISHPIEVQGRKSRLVLVNDVTIRKVAEEEINMMNDYLEKRVEERTRQLEIANRAKSEFLANMGHEIRTPMNAILGYTELLGSLVKGQVETNYIESVKTSGRALMVLINNILDLSKIEADKLDLEYEFINTDKFFSEFRRIFAAEIAERKLNFIIDTSSDIIGFIYADKARLRQVILNLLDNAVKFTEKGIIHLEVYSENLHKLLDEDGEHDVFDLIIEVSDTGVGIPEGSQKVIFNSFVQVRNRLNQGGTGLGLAITQRLVKLMKGTISVESIPEKGSKFTVRIPDVEYQKSNDSHMKNVAFSTESADLPLNTNDEVVFNEDLRDADGLIRALEGEFYTKCMSFELRQPIGEVRDFGKNLADLGKQHNCHFIASYGKELESAADNFNIDVMLKLIRNYTDKVESVKAGLVLNDNQYD
jgi:PAS domain S-box-containing protein